MMNWQIVLIELHILIAFVIGYKLGNKDGQNHKIN